MTRRGIALISVLGVMALVALLTAGSLATSSRLRRGSRLALDEVSLAAGAELALNGVVRDWSTSPAAALPIGGTVTSSVIVPPLTAPASLEVTRLSRSTYWVVASVSSTNGRRRLNLILEVPTIDLDSLGVVSSAGSVIVGSAMTIDVAPAAGPLCVQPPTPRIALAPGRIASDPGGSPAVVGTITWSRLADPSFYSHFAGASLETLRSRADRVIAGGTTATLESAPRLTFIEGDGTLTSGVGSGILVVQGSLRITGPVQFGGVVLANGGIEVTGDGAKIEGVMISGSGADPSNPPHVRLTGHSTILESRCAAQDAVLSAFPPRRAPGRAWSELF